MKIIVVTKDGVYSAYFEKRPDINGTAISYEGAVGNLIINHGGEIGVTGVELPIGECHREDDETHLTPVPYNRW